MTASKPRFEMVTATDPGMVRVLNEDAVFIDQVSGFAILADGMGGYSTGEVASALAIKTVSELLLKSLPGIQEQPLDKATENLHEDITFAVKRANYAIFAESRLDSEDNTMGSTLVVAAILQEQLTVAHVGDSRLYRFRAGNLSQVTRDHSWLQEQIDQGIISVEAAKVSRFKNLVTRGLGIEEDVEVEINDYPIEAEDIFLLCSDGLSDMVDDGDLGNILMEHQQDLPKAAANMVKQANENGGRDNISVILIRSVSSPVGWMKGLAQKLRGFT